MIFQLPNNRANFKRKYQSGLSSEIWIPLNSGRYVGADNQSSIFKNRPDTDSIKLTDWITNQITLGNITVPIAVDDNGIITYLPLGDVVIDSDTNGLSISNTSQFTFNTPAGTGLDISEVSSSSYIQLGDYAATGYGLMIRLNDFTGLLELGDVDDTFGRTKIIIDDSASELYINSDAIHFSGSSYDYIFPNANPANTGIIKQIMTWNNGNPSFDPEDLGLYSDPSVRSSGAVANGHSTLIAGTWNIRADESPDTLQMYYNRIGTVDRTWLLRTGDISGVKEASIFVESYYDKSSPSKITLNVEDTLAGNASTVEVEETSFNVISDNINFTGIPTFADDTAAAALSTGDVYKTATGELRIKL